jgi:hypothetical protein
MKLLSFPQREAYPVTPAQAGVQAIKQFPAQPDKTIKYI